MSQINKIIVEGIYYKLGHNLNQKLIMHTHDFNVV